LTQVIIPSAGLGSRLGTITKNINKALIPVGKKPSISYIIDWYPKDFSFIIAIGYKGQYIKDYIRIAYPKRDIKFVDVKPFDGPGSGLGYTLKCCNKYIKEDFFFHTNDGIILDKINFSAIKTDTIFLSNYRVNSLKYRTVVSKGDCISKFIDKTPKITPSASNYVGVAYIKEFKKFKKFLSKISYELGESDYFIDKIKRKKKVNQITVSSWYDVGDIDDLKRARKDISDFDNLPKEDEFIYFNNDNVIKFFVDKKLSQKRVLRSKKLGKFVPKIISSADNFYAYNFVPGELFSTQIDLYKYLSNFLIDCKKNFWKKFRLSKLEKKNFKNVCLNFYYYKSLDRISSFYQGSDISDNNEIINNVKTPTLDSLMLKVDWDFLSSGIPTRIHGDFHFENILKTGSKKHIFLDWRQDFGGIIEYGDIYYDLAKLYHGIIVDHGAIRNDMFDIKLNDSKKIIDYEIYRKQSSYKLEKILMDFLKKNKLSVLKVKLLTSLIFLNIATLHHQPYSIFLYFLGKDMLNKTLNAK